MRRLRLPLIATGLCAAGWLAFCRPTRVDDALAFYAPGIQLGGDVADVATQQRYHLAFSGYFGYRDVTYTGPDGTRELGLSSLGLQVTEYPPPAVRGTVREVWLQAPTPAAAATVERRLVGLLGRPAITCSRGDRQARPARYLYWKPLLRPGVLLMTAGVPRADAERAPAGRPDTLRLHHRVAAYVVFGGVPPDPRVVANGPCAGPFRSAPAAQRGVAADVA
jgi:hypothetical protein